MIMIMKRPCPVTPVWSFALLLIRQAASASVLSRASVIFAGSRA